MLGAIAGTVAGSGCVGPLTGSRVPDESVTVLAAGSLQQTVTESVRDAVDARVEVEAHGSVTVARLVAAGTRDPDVVALADAALFGSVLVADWYAEFATNALVVAWNPDTVGGRRVARAERWFDPVLAGEATLGRTDPDQDPLGYRTLFALALAEDYYDEPNLRARLLAPDQVYPETSLLSRLETGAVDAAIVYRNMAVERGYDYRDLPAAIDLSDPQRDDDYGEVSYTLPDGHTVSGDHVSYAVQARSDTPAVESVFDALVDRETLDAHGFGVPQSFPRFVGTAPERYRGEAPRGDA